MIAGSILILTAALVYSVYWIGQVMHNSAVVGSSEAMELLAAAVVLALFGGGVALISLVTDREQHGLFRAKPRE